MLKINMHFIACIWYLNKVGVKKLNLLGASGFPDRFKHYSHRLPSGPYDSVIAGEGITMSQGRGADMDKESFLPT